jgi:hypothetical protein
LAYQSLVGVAISSPIAFDLVAPPRGIRLRPCSVDRTAMPKTAIDEDGNLRPQEGNIGPAARSRERHVNAITEAERTQG